jgi:multidrug transporter EmrE-like cation transporter
MKYMEILLIILIVIFEASAQTSLETFTKNNSTFKYLFFGLLFYLFIGFLFYRLLLVEKNLAVANLLWNGGSSILVTLISYFYFKQSFSYKQIIGLIVTFIGVILLGN